MPARELKAKTFKWRRFNLAYGPWHRLVTIDGKGIAGYEVVVQPDMNNQRFYWYVRTGPASTPKRVDNGIAASLEAAQRAALARFEQVYLAHVSVLGDE